MGKLPWCLAVVVALLAPTTALGQSSGAKLDSFMLANDLATVIAYEEACGLKYDQEAIAAFIKANVGENDMTFASTLRTMIFGAKAAAEKAAASEKTAICTQVARSAATYGFTPRS